MDSDSGNVNIQTDPVSEIDCSECGCEIDVSDLDAFVRVECPDCNNIDTVPAKLGPFLLLSLLGTGGMGGVYLAKDETLGRNVAIKVMLSSLGDNEEFVDTFRREAQAVARLNHPNIGQIYSFGQEKGQPYIVMELISGQHLDTLMEEEKELDQGFVAQVGLDIAQGLMAADEAGLIHGDIKPENILLDEKMTAKLVDFGIASFAHQGQTDGIWGTPYYIAPEKIQRRQSDARSDMYSLGATLFHVLTKHPPFEGETPIDVVKARLNAPAPLLSTVRPNIDPRVEQVVARMLEQNPAKRHPTYQSLVSDLKKLVASLGGRKQVPSAKRYGKVIITKKRQAISVSTGTVDKKKTGDVPAAQPTRVRIKRRNASPTVPVTTSVKSVPTTDPTPAKGKKIDPKKKGKKKGSKTGLWIGISILLVLIAVAGIAYKIYLNKQGIAQRRNIFAIEDEHKHAAETYEAIRLSVTNIVKITDTTKALVVDATNAVMIVLGEPLTIPDEDPLEDALPPEEDEGQEGEVEKDKGEADKAKDDPAPEEEAPAEEDAAPEEATEGPDQTEEEPIKRFALDVIYAAQLAQGIASESLDIGIEATDVFETIQTNALSQAEAAEATVIQLTMHLMTMTASVDTLTEHLKKLKANNKEARKNQKKARAAFNKVDAIKTELEDERRAKLIADQKNEADRQADLRKEREAEAYRNLVARETESATDAKTAIEPLLRQHKYKELVDALKSQLGDYESAEGKLMMKILIERYTRLVELKAFVIKGLNDSPYKWGLMTKRGAVSIYGADEKGLKLKDRVLPWPNVSIAQMLKIINNYLDKKTFRTRTLGEQSLSTAVFCFETGGDRATEMTMGYIDRALELCPDLEDKAKELLAPLYEE